MNKILSDRLYQISAMVSSRGPENKKSAVNFSLVLLTRDEVRNALENGVLCGVSFVRRSWKDGGCEFNVNPNGYPYIGVMGPKCDKMVGELIKSRPDGLVVFPEFADPLVISGMFNGQIKFLLKNGVIGGNFIAGPAGVLNTMYTENFLRAANDGVLDVDTRRLREQFQLAENFIEQQE